MICLNCESTKLSLSFFKFYRLREVGYQACSPGLEIELSIEEQSELQKIKRIQYHLLTLPLCIQIQGIQQVYTGIYPVCAFFTAWISTQKIYLMDINSLYGYHHREIMDITIEKLWISPQRNYELHNSLQRCKTIILICPRKKSVIILPSYIFVAQNVLGGLYTGQSRLDCTVHVVPTRIMLLLEWVAACVS